MSSTVTSSTAKILSPGIYAPTLTYFLPTPTQELDIPTHVRHMEFVAKSGIDGVVLQGSTGEAVALDREERQQMISTAKEAWRRVGNTGAIIAGTVGAQSTREAILLSKDAFEAGADFVLVLPPSYFPAAMTPDAIQSFYQDVADASPVPVIIYSYPGVCSGINIDTDLILRLASHPNIAGIKHTDHDIGKISREAAALASLPQLSHTNFTILGGASDYLLGALSVGGKGAITGMANVAPRVCAKAYELHMAGKSSEALKFGGLISRAEWAMGKGAILGTKYAVVWANDYPSGAAAARKPLAKVSDATKKHVEEEFAEIVTLERQLEKEGYVGLALRGDLTAVPSKKVNATNGVSGLEETVRQKVAEYKVDL